jgi:hypothetical protein
MCAREEVIKMICQKNINYHNFGKDSYIRIIHRVTSGVNFANIHTISVWMEWVIVVKKMKNWCTIARLVTNSL